MAIEQLYRQLLLTVSLPKEIFWDFQKQLSELFALSDVDEVGRKFSRPYFPYSWCVDHRNPERRLITVKLPLGEEKRFVEFCDHFPMVEPGEGVPAFRPLPAGQADKSDGSEDPSVPCPVCQFKMVVSPHGQRWNCPNCGGTMAVY